MERYFIDYSVKNGLGHPSLSIYLTGCDNPNKCNDCHNWDLQEESKNDYDIEEIKRQINNEIQKFLQFHSQLYVSILGGEPLSEHNKDIALEISRYMKQKYKDTIVVLYSWRTIEEIDKENLKSYVEYIDYGVLGTYDKNLCVENTIPSSKNQYIYDFKNNKKISSITLKKG